MTARFSTLRSLLVTGIFGALLVAALAFAQQTQEQPSAQPAAPPQGAKPAPIMQPQPTTVPSPAAWTSWPSLACRSRPKW